MKKTLGRTKNILNVGAAEEGAEKDLTEKASFEQRCEGRYEGSMETAGVWGQPIHSGSNSQWKGPKAGAQHARSRHSAGPSVAEGRKRRGTGDEVRVGTRHLISGSLKDLGLGSYTWKQRHMRVGAGGGRVVGSTDLFVKHTAVGRCGKGEKLSGIDHVFKFH